MDTIRTQEAVNETAQDVVDTTPPGSITTLPSAKASSDQWRQIGEQISGFLSELPDYLGQFFSEYQRPLLTIGLVVGGLITVKVTLAVLDAINDIPLLSPVFELVGIGYTGWFVYRYLLRASSRAELADEFNSLKGQVVGDKNS